MAYVENEVKTVSGRSLDECKEKLYKDYGTDYHIVNKTTEFEPGGFLHFRKKPVTVVKYIVNHQKAYDRNTGSYYAGKKVSEEEVLAQNRAEILKNQSNLLINSQISQMNTALEQLKDEFSKKLDNIAVSTQDKHESIKRIEEMLEQNEFSFSYINMIEEKIRNEFSLEQLGNFDLVERRVIDWIGESIEIVKEATYRPPHVFILVGPTGVGKTTTLVKLAAQFVKNYAQNRNGEKPKICFITTDTMRVGAMEQLERWGKHMGSPVYKAEKTEDLRTLYSENKDNMDAIFIDTSGFSPNDATHIAQMKMLIDIPGMNPDIYLVSMASTKSRDLKNIMQNYELFGYKSVIITKCDESTQLGNVISVLYEKHKAISYITHGQIASRDITKANVVDFLIRLDSFKVDRVHIEDKFGE